MREIYKILSNYEPPEKMDNFCVTYRMKSPISLAHPWINGDSLVAQVLMRKLFGDLFYALPVKSVLDLTCLALPLAKTGSIYHCSVSEFDSDMMAMTKFFGRFDSQNIEFCSTKKKRIPQMSGHYKSTMVNIPIKVCNEVKFYVRGNLDECKWIFGAVPALGKDRGKGYGEIESMMIEEIPDDYSIVKDGVIMRPFPVNEMPPDWIKPGTAIQTMMLTYMPPYWDRSKAAECVAPGGKIGREGDKEFHFTRSDPFFNAVDVLNQGTT